MSSQSKKTERQTLYLGDLNSSPDDKEVLHLSKKEFLHLVKKTFLHLAKRGALRLSKRSPVKGMTGMTLLGSYPMPYKKQDSMTIRLSKKQAGRVLQVKRDLIGSGKKSIGNYSNSINNNH